MDDDSTPIELVIIGGGNMGAALLGGLLDSGAFGASAIAVVEVLAARRDVLASQFPGVLVEVAVPPCVGAVVAVKPDDTPTAARRRARAARPECSRSPPVSASRRSRRPPVPTSPWCGRCRTRRRSCGRRRAIAAGATADRDDVSWAGRILGAVGTVVRGRRVPLDAVTGLAGSGPAYLFLVAEALIDAGVLAGLDRTWPSAWSPSCWSVRRRCSTRGDPTRLRAMVTSPGGTTAAGLAALDERGLRGAFGAAVWPPRTAVANWAELGNGNPTEHIKNFIAVFPM